MLWTYIPDHSWTFVQAEEKALLPTDPERSQITTEGSVEAPKRKRKGPKAPNPLSVKKKKMRTDDSNQVGGKRKFEEEQTSHPSGGNTQETGDGKPKRKRRKKVPVVNAEGLG